MLLFTLLAKCLFLTFLRSHFLFFDNLLIILLIRICFYSIHWMQRHRSTCSSDWDCLFVQLETLPRWRLLVSLSLSSVDMVCIGAKNSQTSPLNFWQPQIVMILASRGFAGSVNPALYSLRETLLRIRRWLRRLEKSNSSESLSDIQSLEVLPLLLVRLQYK